MDRKLYLELCQLNSVSNKKTFIKYKSCDYIPKSYQISFNADGSARHTAILYEYKTNILVYCDLKDVEEKND